MKLNVYGTKIEILREINVWVIYELGEGKKTPTNDIYIPSEYNQEEVIKFLEDLFHERATPERPRIQVIE